MSAESIQRKLDVAHKKIGNKLGYTFNLYRPLRNVDVLDDANFIDAIKLTVTLNDSYTKALEWQTPVYTAYTDAAQIQEGDFMYSEDQGRTFLILSRQPHQPVLVIELPDRVDIQTIGYGNDGDGFAPDATTYTARNLPALVSFSSTSKSGMVPGRNLAQSGIRVASIITSLPASSMLMGQTVTDQNGFRGDITSYDYSTVGNAVNIEVQEFSTAQ